MAVNRECYIKYLEYQPVKVETHIDSQRSKREFPLKDIGDLIGAYRTAATPRFVSTPIDELTLHTSSEAEALEVDMLLSALDTGTTAKTALIIKTKSLQNGIAQLF